MAARSRSEAPSLRERKKNDASERMRAAARTLMWERGFDAVTTREIAAEADVGEATLFRYFPSKLDLFLMVYGDEFGSVIDECASNDDADDAESFVGRILACYRRFGDLYVRYPDLAFTFVKESFGSHSPAAESGLTHADRWFELLERIVEQAIESTAFAPVDPSTVVQNCHALYVHEVLRSHARELPSHDLPDRLHHRLETLLLPLSTAPRASWTAELRRVGKQAHNGRTTQARKTTP